jgi:hypothetical protein
MTRVTALTVIVFAMLTRPVTAEQSASGDPARQPDIERVVVELARRAATAVAPIQVQAPPRPPSPPATPVPLVQSAPRRRGSMVGYLDDAVIGTKLRLRYESAAENNVPDRAEFFYAKCGCYRDLPASDPAYDPEAPGPRPGAASDLDFQQIYVQGEVEAGERISFFAELPLRWIAPQEFLPGTGGPFPDKGGIGDLRAGIKVAMAATDSQAVTLQLRGFFPTGKAEDGLGTGHASMEPALLMYHRVSDRASIESQVGLWYPFSGADGIPISADQTFAGSVFFYGIGPSVEVYRNDRFRLAPVVELIGWRVLDGFQTATIGSDAAGTNIVHLKIGARLSVDDSSAIYGGWGRALTDQHWYHDIVRLEFRQTF